MAEEFLDFPQILSHVVEQDCGCGVAQPVGGNLPHPDRSARRTQPQIKRTVGNGAPEYPANTNCDPAKAIPPGAISSSL